VLVSVEDAQSSSARPGDSRAALWLEAPLARARRHYQRR